MSLRATGYPAVPSPAVNEVWAAHAASAAAYSSFCVRVFKRVTVPFNPGVLSTTTPTTPHATVLHAPPARQRRRAATAAHAHPSPPT